MWETHRNRARKAIDRAIQVQVFANSPSVTGLATIVEDLLLSSILFDPPFEKIRALKILGEVVPSLNTLFLRLRISKRI